MLKKNILHIDRSILRPLIALVVMVLTMSLLSESFATSDNLFNVMRQVSVNLCISVGMTLVILTGGIDLSVGSILALSGAVAAGLVKSGWAWEGADLHIGFSFFGIVIVTLLVGGVLGGFNGWMVTRFRVPPFIATLDEAHPVYKSVLASVLESASGVKVTGDIASCFASAAENENIGNAYVSRLDLGTGKAEITINAAEGLFYHIMSDIAGTEITDDADLMATLADFTEAKRKYDKVEAALDEVDATGYGIVVPDIYDLTLEEPEIVKKSGGWGVKLCASAPSIHMIKADIKTEVSPIVGTEAQSEELLNFLLREFEADPRRIWETNMLGKSLYELVNEGLHAKLAHMPDDARARLSETLGRVINEGAGGLVCIIL